MDALFFAVLDIAGQNAAIRHMFLAAPWLLLGILIVAVCLLAKPGRRSR